MLSKPMTDEAQNNGTMSTEKPKKKRKRALSNKAQKMVKLPVGQIVWNTKRKVRVPGTGRRVY